MARGATPVTCVTMDEVSRRNDTPPSEQGSAFDAARSLMLAVAAVLTIVTTQPEAPPPPSPLGRRLGGDDYLGPDGLAVLLLRDVESGVRWHHDARLHERARAPGDGLPAAVPAHVWSLLPSKRAADLAVPQRDRIEELKKWWRRRRAGGVGSASHRGVVGHDGLHYWVRGDGHHIIDQRDPRERVDALPELDRPPGESPLRVQRPGVAAWSAWVDEERGRLCVDVDAEEDGLCTGVLLLEADPACLVAARRFFKAVLANAWDVSRISVQQYWFLWDRAHSRRLLDAINRTALDPKTAERHDKVFERIAGSLDQLLTAVARAFQTPSVALLIPDTAGNIGAISHVGYREPGTPFRLRSGYRGLSHVFCLQYDASMDGTGAAQQYASLPDVKSAYHRFGLAKFDERPGATVPRSETDEQLQPHLYQGDEACPRVLSGPWVYADVKLPDAFWSEPPPTAHPHSAPSKHSVKTRLGGVLRIQGRTPSELDRPGDPPRLASRELVRLHGWAKSVAFVLERLLLANERSLATDIVGDALPYLLRADLRGFTAYLMKSLDAAGVLIFAKETSSFAVMAQKWHPRLHTTPETTQRATNALCEQQLSDAVGDTFVGKRSDCHRVFVPWSTPLGPERLNCVWVPIAGVGALAVVGAPPELRAPGKLDTESDAGWLAERASMAPRFMDTTMTMLRDLLHVWLTATASDSAPPSSTPTPPHGIEPAPGSLASLWKEVSQRWKFEQDRSAPGTPSADVPREPIEPHLGNWFSRAKSRWGKRTFAEMLGTSPSGIERALKMLEDAGVGKGKWRKLAFAPAFADVAAARAELERIRDLFEAISIPPPPPSSAPREGS